MSPRTARAGLLLVVIAGVVSLACILAARVWTGDPMLAPELGGGILVAGWLLLGIRSGLRGQRLARDLAPWCRVSRVAGVDCRVIRGGAGHAFVLGIIRPRIYLGEALLEALDDGELRAVVLHEDHHRRTLAPLRSAALEAWLALVGRWTIARVALVDRLTDLEREADVAALRAGVSPMSLSSALVKSDPSLPVSGVAFAAASDRRLRTLLAMADGVEDGTPVRLPYEWLPVAALAAIAVACHVTGLTPVA